ncbi:MAG TPA: DUF4265 domain-containing protein [Pedobacter sp.]|uniref:DUF4265 domain-containing protein n=1 Tax=Pedobacter sp. TaxID=1411316 RepID=UPI002B9BD4FD|nr:DUF4265 domain-containing protein [Pedobacter sp.]HMI05012.1 DUF4265 domain-containing protein [Pedobacter sp.]
MPAKENYVKILFKFYSDVLDEQTAETMWAEVVDNDKGIYKLDSIPFYAPNIACGDTIIATYDPDEQMLTFEEIIEFSGNSTVQVVLMDKSISTNDVRKAFHDLGCTTEKFKEGYFVIDVPVSLNISPITLKLDELIEMGTIDYAIPCLSEQHR